MIYTFPSVVFRTPSHSLKEAYNFLSKPSILLEEGIYLSSESFWAELLKDVIPPVKERSSLSYAKYQIRSCSRSTPYGTFAGIGIVHLEDAATSIIIDADKHLRKVRIDMNYLTEIVSELMKIDHIKDNVLLIRNNSIYEVAENYRYVQYVIKNNTRYYELISVDRTPYLDAILRLTERGSTAKELVSFLQQSENVSEEEAKAYIENLYESQFLLSELEPCVTGGNPLDRLIAQLDILDTTSSIVQQLKQIKDSLRKPENGISFYKDVELKIKNLGLEVLIPKNTIQTDLFIGLKDCIINKQIIIKVVDQINKLHVLSRSNVNLTLEDFISKFSAKYGEQEVPISIALDTEVGIGYAENNQNGSGENRLINDIKVKGGINHNNYLLDPLQAYVLSKYHDFLENKHEGILIEDEELELLNRDFEVYDYPDSFFLMGSFYKQNGSFDIDNFQFDVGSCSGPSAGDLLARFTHGSPEICSFTRKVLKEEEDANPDAIYAEVAHYPEARIGNVLLRPVLRSYEIPYVGKSGIDLENQIQITDIMVSIRSGKVFLRSKKHNKEVIPRLTTAHNYKLRALPIYRFLGDLKYQGLTQPSLWDWGILSSLKALPRVTYKNIILRKAQWRIDIQQYSSLFQNEDFAYFSEILNFSKIPQRVVYVQNDNKLYIDFGESKGRKLFLHYLKKNRSILIEEFLFTEDNCIIEDKNGDPFTSEFIIPLYRKKEPQKKMKLDDPLGKRIRRIFPPSSEWLYFKIYCGPTIAEKLLKNEILNFSELGLKNKLFEKFFFLRYKDSSSHIRIRFYNSQVERQMSVQKQFMDLFIPLIEANVVEKVVVDTYEREVERYGTGFVEDTENIFCSDSVAILKLIELLDDQETEFDRLIMAIRGIDSLLDDFNYKTVEKLDLLKVISAGFVREFGGRTVERQLNSKYRHYQKIIFSNMDGSVINGFQAIDSVFQARSLENKITISQMDISKNSIDSKTNTLLRHYIHMFINRLFVNNQRKYELVVTHFLERYYASKTAIAKKSVKSKLAE